MSKTILGWWFAPADRRLRNGDGREIQAGVTHTHDGPLVLCESGLHASRNIRDALGYAPGPVVCRVRCGGKILEGDDKLVCSQRTYLWLYDATDALRHFARLCALDAIHMWPAPDVMRRYLRTGDDSLRDAAWAAAVAAWAAARDAAWAAARDAAVAARAKQARRLERIIREGKKKC